ncbi:MAG TPA: Spy/CpxP family protein refolding chaperone, partial [Kofleriaceae bacterium]|nr:Spy/CpxP family protein refolding chaperone [Kofleriaceae bacterium]
VFEDDYDDFDVDLDELQLTKAQRAELRRIGRDQQVVIAPAEQKIHELSRELRKVVDEINADEGQVGRLIDQISAEEAKVRKARITAMTRTRKVLNEAQRRKLDR